MKLFLYVIMNEVDKQMSGLQVVAAADIGSARAHLLEEYKCPAEDLFVMEFRNEKAT